MHTLPADVVLQVLVPAATRAGGARELVCALTCCRAARAAYAALPPAALWRALCAAERGVPYGTTAVARLGTTAEAAAWMAEYRRARVTCHACGARLRAAQCTQRACGACCADPACVRHRAPRRGRRRRGLTFLEAAPAPTSDPSPPPSPPLPGRRRRRRERR